MEEIWKDVENYNGIYQISSFGNLKTLRTNTLIKQEMNKGYFEANLCKNGKVQHVRIHRLVAQAFIPNPLNKPHINHIDGNKSNNNINNLEWCTHKENMVHARKNGLFNEEKMHDVIKAMVNSTKKPVLQLKNNVVIAEFESISDAKRKTKTNHISEVLNGSRKLANGYFWKYKNF